MGLDQILVIWLRAAGKSSAKSKQNALTEISKFVEGHTAKKHVL